MRIAALLLAVWALTACTALHTSVAKRELDVQTRMSQKLGLGVWQAGDETLIVDLLRQQGLTALLDHYALLLLAGDMPLQLRQILTE